MGNLIPLTDGITDYFLGNLIPKGGRDAKIKIYFSRPPHIKSPDGTRCICSCRLRRARHGPSREPLTTWRMLPACDLPTSLDAGSSGVADPSRSEATAASQYVSSDSDSDDGKEFARRRPLEIAVGLPQRTATSVLKDIVDIEMAKDVAADDGRSDADVVPGNIFLSDDSDNSDADVTNDANVEAAVSPDDEHVDSQQLKEIVESTNAIISEASTVFAGETVSRVTRAMRDCLRKKTCANSDMTAAEPRLRPQRVMKRPCKFNDDDDDDADDEK